MKNSLQMTLLIIALLFGSMALGKLLMNPSAPMSTQGFESGDTTKEADTTATEGAVAPAFSAPALYPNNNTLSLSQFEEKYILLNFWASWCTPCITEMPALFSLAKEHPQNFSLIALSIDSKQEKAQQFFASLIKKFDAADAQNIYAAWDQRAQISQNLYGTFQVPESYLISPERKLIKKFSGAVDKAEIAEIRALISLAK